MSTLAIERPYLGFGLGLRIPHFQDILDQRPAVDWFEVLSENFMVDGGKPKYFLHAIREHYPMVMHGVSMSIGQPEGVDMGYVKRLRQLADEVQPEWISDHLCWTGTAAQNLHDLLPLPYTEEALQHIVEQVNKVQDVLGRRLLLENVSSYVQFKDSSMTEWEFISEVANRADCLLLLDVNNIYVSSRNHGFDTQDFIHGVPAERVWQIHLAGHTDYGDYVIDTHDHPIRQEVFELYRDAIKVLGPVSTMIERDDRIPPLAELMHELAQVRRYAEAV